MVAPIVPHNDDGGRNGKHEHGDNDDDNDDAGVMVDDCDDEIPKGSYSPSSSISPDAFSGGEVVAANVDAQVIIVQPSMPAEGGAGAGDAACNNNLGYDKDRTCDFFTLTMMTGTTTMSMSRIVVVGHTSMTRAPHASLALFTMSGLSLLHRRTTTMAKAAG